MKRFHTKATAPGVPSIDVPFTAEEELARDFEEANPTPPPTKAERIARIAESTSDADVIQFKMMFKLHNRVRALEGEPATTVNQFLKFLEGELS